MPAPGCSAVDGPGRLGPGQLPGRSFNSTLKVEFVHRHRHRFRTRAEAALRIVTWITGFYNPTRRHSLCGGISPINYETHKAAVRAASAAALSRDETT
ncbi:IS3 family transposase [Nocardia sp. NPDC052278]|uniref:IS3 family transposase n=1 Tax=unclassified Nocardia TaxID=2637762 RepID=UPI00368FC6E6